MVWFWQKEENQKWRNGNETEHDTNGKDGKIDQKAIELLDLTEEVLEIPSGKHNRSKVERRLSWTRTRMKQFGMLENSAKGIWALTEQASRMKKVDGAALLRKAREIGR